MLRLNYVIGTDRINSNQKFRPTCSYAGYACMGVCAYCDKCHKVIVWPIYRFWVTFYLPCIIKVGQFKCLWGYAGLFADDYGTKAIISGGNIYGKHGRSTWTWAHRGQSDSWAHSEDYFVSQVLVFDSFCSLLKFIGHLTRNLMWLFVHAVF